MSLRKRVVVITGGGSGMGKAMAQLFADNGDQVYILGRRKDTLKTVAQTSKLITAVPADVTQPASIESAVKTIIDKYKRVDVLINCAGSSGKVPRGQKLDAALADWQAVVRVNLDATFLVIYAFEPYISRPGGRIINISSVAALQGSSRAGGEAYAASKAGVHGLSRTLVKDLSPQGITVNCIAPGVIENTDFFGGNPVPEDMKQKYLDVMPIKRLGEPEEIAAAAFYLASDEAGFITGEILNINGGVQFGR